MNPALSVIILFSLAAAQPEPTCANGQQCDPGQLVGGDGDPSLSLLQHQALIKAHGRNEGDEEVPEEANPPLSLLQLAERVAGGTSSTKALLQSVQQMAEQDARGELHADKITEQVLKTIIESMEKNVIGAAQKMHKEDQNEVNRAHKAIDTCKANMDDKFSKSGGINALKTTMETGKSTLTTCKTEQATMNSTQQKDCTDFESWVSGGLHNSRPSCVCTLPTTPSASVLECINQAKSWGTTSSGQYKKMKAECDSSTTDLGEKDKKCDSDQSSFESSFCSYGLLLVTTCQDYDKCHGETTKAYADVCKDVKVDEVSRKAEFSAAKNVICFVGVLRAKAADKAKELTACKGKTYSTAELDMTYPTASSKATCDVSPVASKPCDASFLSTHYDAAWSALAPAEKCTPCTPWPTGGGGGGATTPIGLPSVGVSPKCTMEDGWFKVQGSASCMLGNPDKTPLVVDFTKKKYTKYAFTIKMGESNAHNGNVHPHGGFKPCNRDSTSSSRGSSPELWFIDRGGDWGWGLYNGGWGHMARYQSLKSSSSDPNGMKELNFEAIFEWDGNQYKLYKWKVADDEFPLYKGRNTGCSPTSNYAFTPRLWAYGGADVFYMKDLVISQADDPAFPAAAPAPAPAGVVFTKDNYNDVPCAKWIYGGFGARGKQVKGMRSAAECAKYAIDNGYKGFTTAWNVKPGYRWQGQTYSEPSCKGTSGTNRDHWKGKERNHCEYKIYSPNHCWMRDTADKDCVHYCADGYGPSWATYTVTAGTACPLDANGHYKAPAPAPVQAFRMVAQGKACKNYHTASIEPGAAERYSATDNCLSLDRSQCEARCRTTPNCVIFQSPNNEAKSKAAGACNCYLFAAGQCSQQSHTFYSIWNQA